MRKSILLPIIILGTVTIEAFIPQLDGRIVGGKDANITSFPYQVSLLRGLSHVCGGSIFHTNYILTAAHCVHGYLTTLFSIRVGSSIANQGDGTFKVCKIHIHDKFDQNTMDNDIAILTLCSPLKFSATVLPIALPGSSEAIPTGAKATVTGWGVLKETDKAVSKILQQVDIPILSQKSCLSVYGGEYITSNMFCAGYVGKGAKDACQGDSGGPLMANGKLFGIVSWGVGCAHPKYPGVYTNVPVFRGWIRDYTKY